MRYRVNYGNGQVSHTYTSKKDAVDEIKSANARNQHYAGLFRLQFEDNGEWFFDRTKYLKEKVARHLPPSKKKEVKQVIKNLEKLLK